MKSSAKMMFAAADSPLIVRSTPKGQCLKTVSMVNALLDFIDWKRAGAEFKQLDQVVGTPKQGLISFSEYLFRNEAEPLRAFEKCLGESRENSSWPDQTKVLKASFPNFRRLLGSSADRARL